MSNIFRNQTVVITGLFPVSRHELENMVRSMGGQIRNVVDKKATLLIAGELPGSKLDKARSLGIRIIRIMADNIEEDEDETTMMLKSYMNLPYRMEIIPDAYEGGYTARFPDLKGCVSVGDTIEEAVNGLHDAQQAWFEAAIEEGRAIPIPVY